jgi:serine protease AprX
MVRSRSILGVVLALVVMAATFGPLGGSAAASPTTAVVDPRLSQRMATALGPFQVIVTFRGEGAPGVGALAALGQAGIVRGKTLRALPMAGVLATSLQIRALAASPEVRSIWLNSAIQRENAASTDLTGVDRLRADEGLTAKNGGVPVTGRDVGIVVNDSGVDGTHPDLANNVAVNVQGHLDLSNETTLLPAVYLEGVPNTDVGGGHGSHCAGIAAGTGAASNGVYEGVAPGARIVGFGSGAGLAILNTLGGFDYAVANRERFDIRVITNSWGDTADTGDFNPDHPVNVASKACNDAGIAVVFSAGNAGPGAGTISGNYKKAPWVICVAAGDANRALASFSSRGREGRTVTVTGSDGQAYVSEDRPTVTAPGVAIVSARAAGSSLSPLSAPDDALGVPPEALPYYTILSGTSMAAPHVAGIVALMLDANPSLTPAAAKSILEDTADAMDGYESWEVGAGFANAYDAVAACFDTKIKKAKCNQKNPCGEGARSVVAVIDSAVNPYHEYFNAGGPLYGSEAPSSVTPEVLAAFGVDESHRIRLTRTGDFAADYAADAAAWAAINPGELYWFEGTNILAISFDGGARPILPDDDADTHGVGTTAAVLGANPEAIVVFVEGITEAAETFAFTHPEIDIVTTSYGPIGSIPLPSHIGDSYTGVVVNGKLHFGAADNSPSPAIQDGTAGPWWSIGVAGFEEHSSEGRQVLSGSFPDFVADFTQTLPYCHDCESGTEVVGGTSFATPRSAGTMSRVLLEARRALNHTGGIRTVGGTKVMAAGANRAFTNWQFRRALEQAAYYPSVVDYVPGGTGDIDDITSVPVVDATPWTQVGWGAITPDPVHQVVEQALANLGIRGYVTRFKPYLACEYQSTLVTARHVYWDNVAIESESWLVGGPDPYIYCGQ